MFSFLRKNDKSKSAGDSVNTQKNNTRSSVKATEKESDSVEDLKINYDSSVAIEMNVEVGGGKGWPVDVTTVLYHKLQGLICIGTSGGAVYVYGDGFQFMRPWLTNDPNPVQDIIAMYPNRILVAFEDNSMVLMELPSLDVVDLLPSSWLNNGTSSGVSISSIHVDLPMEKNFVYVGTTDASVLVLDANSNSLRVCEYKLTYSDLGVSNPMTVVDIQSCPKDEKYLAIGLNNSNQNKKMKTSSPGYVIIFDLVKHKPYKSFPTSSVSSMAWIHTGDILYVGTVDGQVLSVNFEKNVCTSVWNSKQELVEDTNDNNDDSSVEDSEGPKVASIKRISWMASQIANEKERDGDEFGVLFVLLDTDTDTDNEDLTNVIVGLSPTGPVDAPQELSVIYSLPPIQLEKIKTFRIVPTFDLVSEDEEEKDQTNRTPASPAILILSWSQISNFNNLKIVRCPTSSLSNWALEIGMTLDPRQAVEVLPSQSKITCMSAIKSEKCPQSITTALVVNNSDINRRISSSYSIPVDDDANALATFNYDENKTIQMDKNKTVTPPRSSVVVTGNRSTSRKLSVREFFIDNSLLESESKWEMTLAHGVQKENDNKNNQRQQDLLIKGHADGTVIIWGVSLPDNGKELGRGNIWLPLQVLKCGTTAIVTINHDESSGLLLAADESGIVVIWELYDEVINMSASDLLSNIYDEAVTMVAKQIGENLNPNPDDHLTIKDYAKFCYYSNKYRPTCFKFLLKSRFHDKVTCSLFLSTVMSLIVGTQDGSLYFCADFRKGSFSKLDIDLNKIENSSSVGSVISLTMSTFEFKNKLIPVVYCVFSSGHLLVIELKNFNVIFATTGSLSQSFENLTLKSKIDTKDYNENSNENHNLSVESVVLNSLYSAIKTPDVIDISLYRLSLDLSIMEQSTSSINSINNDNDISNLPPPPTKSKISNLFSSLTKSKSGVITVPAVVPQETVSIAPTVETILPIPQTDIPRYLMFINGRSLVSYDLSKTLINSKPNNKEFSSLAPLKTILSCSLISKKKIIASKLLEYIPNEKDEEDSENLICFAGVSSIGVFVLVSLKNSTVISHSHLLESALDNEVTNLDFGVVLDNSNCYMIQSSSMIYSASPICSTHSLVSSLPDRGTVICNPPSEDMMLLNGREIMIEQMKTLLKKRRSTLINMTSVTDLVKLFAKSRTTNQKEELFGEEESNIAATKGSKMPNTNAALAACEELGKALEERGEKISRITKKMDLFKETANMYKQQAHEQKEKLKKQNNNWGLF